MRFICLSVSKMRTQKTRFSQKLSNLELQSLLTTYTGNPTWAFQWTHYWIHKFRHLENRQIAIFQQTNHPISMKFCILMQIWNSMIARWANINIFKFQDNGWSVSILKIIFVDNSAANCPISVTICTGKQNSMAIKVTCHTKMAHGRHLANG